MAARSVLSSMGTSRRLIFNSCSRPSSDEKINKNVATLIMSSVQYMAKISRGWGHGSLGWTNLSFLYSSAGKVVVLCWKGYLTPLCILLTIKLGGWVSWAQFFLYSLGVFFSSSKTSMVSHAACWQRLYCLAHITTRLWIHYYNSPHGNGM